MKPTNPKPLDNKIKYIIDPGYVRSKSDGDVHYISAQQLMKLYNVSPAECLINHVDNWQGYTDDFIGNLIWLRARIDGDYTL